MLEDVNQQGHIPERFGGQITQYTRNDRCPKLICGERTETVTRLDPECFVASALKALDRAADARTNFENRLLWPKVGVQQSQQFLAAVPFTYDSIGRWSEFAVVIGAVVFAVVVR